jgi:hypothetical protein
MDQKQDGQCRPSGGRRSRTFSKHVEFHAALVRPILVAPEFIACGIGGVLRLFGNRSSPNSECRKPSGNRRGRTQQKLRRDDRCDARVTSLSRISRSNVGDTTSSSASRVQGCFAGASGFSKAEGCCFCRSQHIKKRPASCSRWPFLNLILAATYVPTQLPVQYHRPCGA